MKTHLRPIINTTEFLKFLLIGIPITMLLAYMLSIPVYSVKEDIQHHNEIATSTVTTNTNKQ